MDNASGHPDATCRILARAPVLVAGLLAGCLLSGCADIPEPDKGANQSLVEIGERSLEEGEALESEGRKAEAQAAYRRSQWAFRYHEHLTGEEPFLLEEAIEGIKRTETRRRR
ncbi:MAG: hypothetical protein LUC93_00735 [Planctomycetaceae bacterium]|nr:hypothetical protein [Planctomycetaceae bacterium]